jgi:hypothetical protein
MLVLCAGRGYNTDGNSLLKPSRDQDMHRTSSEVYIMTDDERKSPNILFDPDHLHKATVMPASRVISV